MRIIISILLFLFITACGGSGSGSGATDKEKYSTSNYKDLAGTWTPWISKTDYEDDDNYDYFELSFSRFGSISLFASIDDIYINCFGNYDINGFRQDSALNCNSTDMNNEFFDFNFSSTFDKDMMLIDTVELSNMLLISEFDDDMTLYKNPIFWMDEVTNIQSGIYDVFEIDDVLIRVSSNGQIETVKNNEVLNVDCEINGSVKPDPDYGLTTQNQVSALFVDSHEAMLDVKGCYIEEKIEYISSKIDINQVDQVSILRAGYWNNNYDSYDVVIDLTASGNTSINGGNNSFYLILTQVCDELGIRTDYAVNNYDYNYCEDYN